MTYLAHQFDHAPAEQSVIAICLHDASRLDVVLGKLSPSDFVEPIHQQIMQVLAELRAGGRSPSVESIILHLGDKEVVPGMTLRGYLIKLSDGLVTGQLGPWQDATEVLFDQAQRRNLHAIGTELAAAAVACPDTVVEIVARGLTALDDAIAAQRVGRCQVYDLRGSANFALQHLENAGHDYPTTGLDGLDELLGGWPRGQLSIVAGRPGMGKSTAALMSLLTAAKAGSSCLFYSLEMGAEQIGARLLTDLAYSIAQPIFYEDVLHRRVDERQRARLARAADLLDQLPVLVEEQRGVTVGELCAKTRKQRGKLFREGKRLDIIFVDHILLLRPSSKHAGNRVREVAEISDALATLAKELEVAVVGLCQLNRSVESRENKRPSLSDLRDSGAIEEDASSVTFLYRPAYYLENLRYDDADAEAERLRILQACRNRIELLVAKNRNGRTGVIEAFIDIGASVLRDKLFAKC